MSDRPKDFEDDDIDMGEPVTDQLNVLLEELSGEGDRDGGEVDLGDPVTDQLNFLLDALPADWDQDDDEDEDVDLSEPVTDRLNKMLAELPGGDFSARVRRAAEEGNVPTAASAEPAPPRAVGFWGSLKALLTRRS